MDYLITACVCDAFFENLYTKNLQDVNNIFTFVPCYAILLTIVWPDGEYDENNDKWLKLLQVVKRPYIERNSLHYL